MLTFLSQLVRITNENVEECLKKLITLKFEKLSGVYVLYDKSKKEDSVKVLRLPPFNSQERGDFLNYLNYLVNNFYSHNIIPTSVKGGRLSLIGEKRKIKKEIIEIKDDKEFSEEKLEEKLRELLPKEKVNEYIKEIKRNIKEIKEEMKNMKRKSKDIRIKIYFFEINGQLEKNEILLQLMGISEKEITCIICGKKGRVIEKPNLLFDTITSKNIFFSYLHSLKLSNNIPICISCATRLLSKLEFISFIHGISPTIVSGLQMKCFPYSLSGEENTLKTVEDIASALQESYFDDAIKKINNQIIRGGEPYEKREYYLDCYIFRKNGNDVDIIENVNGVKLINLIFLVEKFEEYKKEFKKIKGGLFSPDGLLKCVLISTGRGRGLEKYDPSSKKVLLTILRKLLLQEDFSLQERKLLLKILDKKIRSFLVENENESNITRFLLLLRFLSSLPFMETLKNFKIEEDIKNIMEINNAKDFLVFIGRVLREIDEAMKKEGIKKVRGLGFLGKEDMKIEDIKKIVNRLPHDCLLYLEEELPSFKDKEGLVEKLMEELKNLEREGLLKFYMVYGYFRKDFIKY